MTDWLRIKDEIVGDLTRYDMGLIKDDEMQVVIDRIFELEQKSDAPKWVGALIAGIVADKPVRQLITFLWVTKTYDSVQSTGKS